MTQRTLDNLSIELNIAIAETETKLDHTLLTTDRILLHTTLLSTIQNAITKYINGSKEHSDGVTPFHKSCDSVRELKQEAIDILFYIAALERAKEK